MGGGGKDVGALGDFVGRDLGSVVCSSVQR